MKFSQEVPWMLVGEGKSESMLEVSIIFSTMFNFLMRNIFNCKSQKIMSGFEDYSEFLIPDYSSSHKNSSPGKAHHYGSDYSLEAFSPADIDAMLKKQFQVSQYPADIITANIFCPICGKQVKQSDPCSIYKSDSKNRNFLAHNSCLTQENTRLLSDVFDHIDEMIITPAALTKKEKELNLCDREFCIELSISHPLSDYSFLKLITKKTLQNNIVRWQFQQPKEEETLFCYDPNVICFPYVDFNISLTFSEIGVPDSKRSVKNYVNLSKIKLSAINSLTANLQDLKLQMQLHKSPEQKQKIINHMNYKYRYSEHIPTPIIELVALQLTIPEEYDNYEFQLEQSNSAIIEIIEDQQEKLSYQSSYHSSTIPLNQYENMSNTGNSVSSIGHQYGSQSPNKNKGGEMPGSVGKIGGNTSAQKQKMDGEKLIQLIQTKKLSSFARNNTQSRLLQNFLVEMATEEQIQQIIYELYPELSDLIMNEYANYMMQKLFQVSNLKQRIQILTKLYPEIPALVKNKQGTHTVQDFLDFFQSEDEHKLICDAIQATFQELCFHHISTHFIQKIVKKFPLHLILDFFSRAKDNFPQFAIDKNAMCVLKYMMRRIQQRGDDPLIYEYKKHFINCITFNTDKIIQDCYGNYVVQFCYEYFGEGRSSGITEMILQKFTRLSVQKYSCNVVLKCINKYWSDRSYLMRLKDTMRADGIIEMFRNKEGNRILLDLLNKNDNYVLREKIYSVLVNGESSKFNHDGWAPILGIRSGPVGVEFRNFSQADAYQKKTNGKKSRKK